MSEQSAPKSRRRGRALPGLLSCWLLLGEEGLARAKDFPAAVASYQLTARLDAQQHSVTGHGTITLTNHSTKPLSELWFHLYLNAFENPRTLYLRDKGGRSGGLVGAPGHIEVTRLSLREAPDENLWEKAAQSSPGDPLDRTDIAVPLPRELLPGASLVLDVQFVAQLPEIVERTGYQGDFHLVAQWFPKLARLEDDGTFAHFAFHPYGEFYADFGDYDVELDVPTGHVVGSSGVLLRVQRGASRTLYRARARGIHDFAWTSYPGFVEEQRRLGTTTIKVLAEAQAKRGIQALWQTVEAALPYYQNAYGPYPYETLTIVHPPRAASRAGGMEYPTFFTTGGSELAQALGLRWAETVTAHELGHQWFQGLVATNEQEFPFLDEGLTSHAEWRVLEHVYGSGSALELPGLRVSRAAIGRYSGLRIGPEERIAQPARAFSSFAALAGQVYGRAALSLETLRRVYGADPFDRALRSYADRHRFDHPEPDDLYACVEQELGAQARSALEVLLNEAGHVDLRVGPLVTTPSARTSGGGGRAPSSTGWSTRATLRLGGNVILPYDVLVEFADGRRQTHHFSAPRAVEILEFSHDSAISRLVMDPERKILIDENLLNNRVLPDGPASLLPETARAAWLLGLLHRLLLP